MTVTPTLAQAIKLQADGKLKPAHLAGFLAAAKVFHEQFGRVPPVYQGSVNVPVPAEIITMIAERLIAPSEWLAIVNAEKVKAGRRKADIWQKQANEIWQRKPSASKSTVAKEIDPGRWHYVRQRLAKPKI